MPDMLNDQYQQAVNESARLLRSNRPGEAIQRLLPLYQKNRQDADIAINLGGAYILQHRWNKAVKVLEPVAKAHPKNAMLWINLAAAYLGRLETAGPRQQEQAIAAYERAIQADPHTPNAHYHLGLIHKERGDLNRACAHFQRALETDPADRDARNWLDRLGHILAEEQQQRLQDSETGQPDDISEDGTDSDVTGTSS
jgi:tetratricopeptide (TPR) repeat protein